MEKDYILSINGAERRFFLTSKKPFETRAAQDGEPESSVYIKGYAALTEVPTILYENANESYEEVIAKGAFDDVLENDVRCLFNHDSNQILGRSAAGTLTYGVDESGLFYECMLDNTIMAHSDLYKSISRGDISQSSFAFKVKEDKVEMYNNEETDKEVCKRTILKFQELYDVSPVTFPAYADTSVMGRSVQNLKAEIEAAKNAATDQRKADDLFLAKQLERKIKTNN
jgi:HK97 family phage prohead protease